MTTRMISVMWVRVACTLVALLVAGSISTGLAWAQEAVQSRLTVTGEGRVDRAPDMATITLGVEAEAESAADALDETSRITAEILARLEAAGIEGRDLQTRDLSLSPIWDHAKASSKPDGRPGIVGYRAANMVMVRVRDLGRLGGILDTVADAGATNFNGLQFGLQNPDPVRDDARRAAVAEALRKARLYAEAAGVELGPILEISEADGGRPEPVMMARAEMVAESVPVAGGEVGITARVTMVFEIGTP